MRSMDVVLVDDDAGFRAIAREVLASAGFTVSGEAGTGLDAIRTVADVEPTIVLLDVQLPDMDGFEVTRRLRLHPSPPAVVLISTREAADYGRRIADCGALGFITKARLSGSAVRTILDNG